ncbi:hypothetical protein QTO34_005676 [Cnephaeus nilssonii]|uniref:Nuclear Testis protein N-terminal domain-containing protein n=1 Tax=Cnephaeus nilssonii TaxID=3371016 RepID=A0AA40HNU5_CNENI|nr:hypothetical protein QTO34_005676 [Eptesicus nilssonii]
MDQVRSEGGRPQPSLTQTIVLTQAPLYGSAPGAICGGAVCPAPLFLEASAVETIMPTSAFGGAQAGDGGWCPGLPPQAPPPAAQLAPIVPSVNAGASRKGGLAASQSRASLEDSCNPNSVYKNFRRWQRFKALARQHLPQSPDAEALSCFLMIAAVILCSVLLGGGGNLAPLSWGDQVGGGQAAAVTDPEALQPSAPVPVPSEAHHDVGGGNVAGHAGMAHKSNFDRMIYYEMAEKAPGSLLLSTACALTPRFMEFEAEEQMQIQKLQLKKGVQTQPPPAPPRPDPQGPPVPVVGTQPARTPRKAVPSAQNIQRYQRPQETKSPNEIPPEAVREYMDIMDNLLGLPHSATEAAGEGWEDEVKEWLQDEGLLSYLDQLCSQEDFVTQVGWLAARGLQGPRGWRCCTQTRVFPQADGIGLCSLLLSWTRPADFQFAPSQGAHGCFLLSQVEAVIHPQFMEQIISPDAQQDPLALAEELEQEEGLTAAQLVEKRLLASKEGGVQAPLSHGPHLLTLHWDPGMPVFPEKASLVRETLGTDRFSEDEEDLPSLAFLLGSPNSLLPCGLSLSPVPASGLACPGGRGPRGAAQSQFFQTLGLSRASPAASKSRKRALGGSPTHAEKTPHTGADLGVCGRPALALELVCSSQPHKKKCDLVTGRISQLAIKAHEGTGTCFIHFYRPGN